LVAVLLPLAFNPYATLPFEPFKVLLFQGITVGVAATALGFSFLRLRYASPPRPRRAWSEGIALLSTHPLALPALTYAFAYGLATTTSINPRLSLWGASDRHGALTIASTLVFFLLVSSALRAQKQVERVITVLLLGSVPIALYGVAQHLGLDPINWITDSVSPVLSTMGRSNFLGAYLAMVLPFSLSRILRPVDGTQRLRYTIILLLQMSCLLLTQARAAWLGFTVGCLLFLALLARRWRSWPLVASFMFVLVAGSLFFVRMSGAVAANATEVSQSQAPSFSELREASADRRIIIWQNTLRLIPARWLLGYGPETYLSVFSSHHPPGTLYDGKDALVDDPHNLLLDQLMAVGVVGFLAFVWTIVRFYRVALRTFGREKNRWGETTVAAILASATAFLVQAQFTPDVIVLVVLFWLVLALGVVVHRGNYEEITHQIR
jgi:O-antigen ligase